MTDNKQNIIYDELTPNTQFIFGQNEAWLQTENGFQKDLIKISDKELRHATKLGKILNKCLFQLVEQEIAFVENQQIKIPYENFKFLYDSESGYNLEEFLPSYCPFSLDINSKRDLGSDEFEYDYKFYWGTKEIYPQRYGCFVKHRRIFYYLEPDLFSLIEKLDNFNNLPKENKNKIFNLKAFADIKDLIKKIDLKINDSYLAEENVILPEKIKFNIKEDSEGNITVIPEFENVPNESFESQYTKLSEAQDIYDTDINNTRSRVILDDDIKKVAEVLKKDFSSINGNKKDEFITDPRKALSEHNINQDLIDLSDYGERVKGIGNYIFKPKIAFRSSGAGFLDDIDNIEPVIIAETGSGEPIELPIKDYIENIDKAINNEETVITINVDNKEYKFQRTPAIDDFVRDYQNIKRKREETDTPTEEMPKIVKKYLLIHDNDEEQSYSEYISSNENKLLSFYRPESLNELIATRDGDKPLELFDYQKQGIAWLQAMYEKNSQKGLLLADDMGLGKTLQVLSFLAWVIEREFSEAGPYKPILVVAPPILLEIWRSEIEKFFKNQGAIFSPFTILHGEILSDFKKTNIKGKELDYAVSTLCSTASQCLKCEYCNDVEGFISCRINKRRIDEHRLIITNYETVKNYQYSLAKVKWTIVALDEAQYIKEPNTANTHAVKALSGNAQYKLAMTGTPVENKLLDLWSIMDYAYSGLLPPQKEFIKRYDIDYKKTEEAERFERANALKQKLRLQPLVNLNEKQVMPYLIRRNKEEYLSEKLPKKIDGIEITCYLTPEQEQLHKQIIFEAKNTEGKKQHLAAIQKLTKMYQHIDLLKDTTLASNDDYVTRSPKLQAVIEKLKIIKSKNEKVLIFVTSRKMQDILKETLDKEFNLNIGIINGSINNNISEAGKSVRLKYIDEFESKSGFNILILSPHVAGVGLTILGANHVIHYGRWWNPAKEAQATDRVYRIGQKKEVSVYYPIYKGQTINETFDEKLNKLLTAKKELAKDFLSPLESLDVSAEELFNEFNEQDIDLSDAKQPNMDKNLIKELDSLSHNDFKLLIVSLFEKQQYQVALTPKSQNEGIDIVARKNDRISLIKIPKINEENLDFIIDEYRNSVDFYKKSFLTNYQIEKNIIINIKTSKEFIKQCKDNNIALYDRNSLPSLIKSIKLTYNDLYCCEPEILCSFSEIQKILNQ
ncbi:MAG: SNF2-related protein [Candidatus Gastranaerophilales bacterium]|nr:SNF2-related protein [Candidatus Gastranaerophilales bacterium]